MDEPVSKILQKQTHYLGIEWLHLQLRECHSSLEKQAASTRDTAGWYGKSLCSPLERDLAVRLAVRISLRF